LGCSEPKDQGGDELSGSPAYESRWYVRLVHVRMPLAPAPLSVVDSDLGRQIDLLERGRVHGLRGVLPDDGDA